MGQQLNLAKSRLFDTDSLALSDIKLFPGSNRDATREQFAEEINKVMSRIVAGDYDDVDVDGKESE